MAAGFLALPAPAPAETGPEPAEARPFPALPSPPAIEGLLGLPQTFTKAPGAYLALIAGEAERRGLPPAVADAVAKIESGFDPRALGGVGEVGLMQIRPQTAAMLGYGGDAAGLFEPETNVRFGVAYLARAWELAGGDLCRALMKYRAGWGEERMTPLSVEYCRRARVHLAAIGSPLAGDIPPESTGPAAFRPTNEPRPVPLAGPLPPAASQPEKSPTEKRREMWAEHDRRLAAIAAKTPWLRIMSGF